MTQLMQRSDEMQDTHPAEHRKRWSSPTVALVAMLALLLGLLGGWWVNDDHTASQPAAVVAGSAALTSRQEEMVAMARDYMSAWRSNDPATVLAFYTPYASFVETPSGMSYNVADGSMQVYLGSADWSSMQVVDPILVNGHDLTVISRLGGVQFTNLLRFTLTDELLVQLHMVTSK
jgi:ketosteroid isomerase-like protein